MPAVPKNMPGCSQEHAHLFLLTHPLVLAYAPTCSCVRTHLFLRTHPPFLRTHPPVLANAPSVPANAPSCSCVRTLRSCKRTLLFLRMHTPCLRMHPPVLKRKPARRAGFAVCSHACLPRRRVRAVSVPCPRCVRSSDSCRTNAGFGAPGPRPGPPCRFAGSPSFPPRPNAAKFAASAAAAGGLAWLACCLQGRRPGSKSPGQPLTTSETPPCSRPIRFAPRLLRRCSWT